MISVRAGISIRGLSRASGSTAVTAGEGLTVASCRQHGASLIIRGARNRSDLRYEYQLAAMNETPDITTLLLPDRSALAATSRRFCAGSASESSASAARHLAEHRTPVYHGRYQHPTRPTDLDGAEAHTYTSNHRLSRGV